MEERLIAATKELETLRQAADPEALRTLRRELSETKRDAKEFRRQVAAFEAERAEAQSARRAMAQEKNLPRLQAAMSDVTAERNRLAKEVVRLEALLSSASSEPQAKASGAAARIASLEEELAEEKEVNRLFLEKRLAEERAAPPSPQEPRREARGSQEDVRKIRDLTAELGETAAKLAKQETSLAKLDAKVKALQSKLEDAATEAAEAASAGKAHKKKEKELTDKLGKAQEKATIEAKQAKANATTSVKSDKFNAQAPTTAGGSDGCSSLDPLDAKFEKRWLDTETASSKLQDKATAGRIASLEGQLAEAEAHLKQAERDNRELQGAMEQEHAELGKQIEAVQEGNNRLSQALASKSKEMQALLDNPTNPRSEGPPTPGRGGLKKGSSLSSPDSPRVSIRENWEVPAALQSEVEETLALCTLRVAQSSAEASQQSQKAQAYQHALEAAAKDCKELHAQVERLEKGKKSSSIKSPKEDKKGDKKLQRELHDTRESLKEAEKSLVKKEKRIEETNEASKALHAKFVSAEAALQATEKKLQAAERAAEKARTEKDKTQKEAAEKEAALAKARPRRASVEKLAAQELELSQLAVTELEAHQGELESQVAEKSKLLSDAIVEIKKLRQGTKFLSEELEKADVEREDLLDEMHRIATPLTTPLTTPRVDLPGYHGK